MFYYCGAINANCKHTKIDALGIHIRNGNDFELKKKKTEKKIQQSFPTFYTL